MGAHALDLIFGELAQNVAGIIVNSSNDDEIAQALEKILRKATWIVARFDNAINCFKDSCRVACRKSVDRLIKKCAIGVAKKLNGDLIGDAIFSSTGKELAKHRERISNRAARCTNNKWQYTFSYFDAFSVTDLF